MTKQQCSITPHSRLNSVYEIKITASVLSTLAQLRQAESVQKTDQVNFTADKHYIQ